MRILFLASCLLGTGGSERQLALLADGLAIQGHEVSVLVNHGSAADTLPLLRAQLLVPAEGCRGGSLRFASRVVTAITRMVPDVVHGYLAAPNILALSGRVLASQPAVVWGVRASGMELSHYGTLARLAHVVEAKTAAFAHLMIANSRAGAAHAIARGFPAERMTVIENGIATDRFTADIGQRVAARARLGVGDGPLIGHVARIDPMKDHATFLMALALVMQVRSDVCAIAIAPGPDSARRALVQRSQELGIDGRLRWLANISDLAQVYPALDVCILSSAFGEGFPNVVGEAMACGVACAVTDVGDAARLVAGTGAVAAPADPAALARAVLAVLERSWPYDPAFAQQVAAGIAPFSVDHMVRRTQAQLAALVARIRH